MYVFILEEKSNPATSLASTRLLKKRAKTIIRIMVKVCAVSNFHDAEMSPNNVRSNIQLRNLHVWPSKRFNMLKSMRLHLLFLPFIWTTFSEYVVCVVYVCSTLLLYVTYRLWLIRTLRDPMYTRFSDSRKSS